MSRLTVLYMLLVSLSTVALAQSPCPTQEILGSAAKRSSDLVCVVPQVYGPGGLVGTDNGGPLTSTKFHEVHFQASSINSFGPINAEIGVQLSQVPLASPVSGFIFAKKHFEEPARNPSGCKQPCLRAACKNLCCARVKFLQRGV